MHRKGGGAVDGYQQASLRALLLVLIGVVAAIIVIWLLVSWGMGAGDLQAPPFDGPRLPGVNK